MVLTAYGMEGGALYAISPEITRQITKTGTATIHMDLRPDFTVGDLTARLQNRGKASLSNHLRKKLKLSPLELALLYELTEKRASATPARLRDRLNLCPSPLQCPPYRPRYQCYGRDRP